MQFETNRRGVLGFGLAGLASPAWAMLPGDAELIVRNARVHTVADQQPAAQAFAGKRTQIIDARGQAVVPGFIDCPNHAVGETLLYEVIVGNS